MWRVSPVYSVQCVAVCIALPWGQTPLFMGVQGPESASYAPGLYFRKESISILGEDVLIKTIQDNLMLKSNKNI